MSLVFLHLISSTRGLLQDSAIAVINIIIDKERSLRPRDAVYASLKRRILLNELRPETVLTELAVAQELGCSQGPVREALLRLQEDGLVLRSGHRGTTVTPLDEDAAAEMLALRHRLETRGAVRAARHAGPHDIVHLRTMLGEMKAVAQAGDEYGLIEIDTDFHLSIFRLAGLRSLEQILLRCILHSHRQKLWEPRHRRPLAETAARHQSIIEALERGGEALAEALGRHIDTIVDVAPERMAG